MPLPVEDATPLDITGDPEPTRPLTAKAMQGAVSRKVNRTSVPAGGDKPGVKPSAPPGEAKGQAKQDPKAQQQQAQGEAEPDVGQRLGNSWDALTGGVGDILKDPAWMQHPLLRLFSDPTDDPNQMSQDLWSTTQWWGRVMNAAFDPNAIHGAEQNILHDNSVKGKIAQGLFGINPETDFAWNIIPYLLTAGAEWEPWMWLPAMSTGAPSQFSQLPGAAMGLFGNDLSHPKFQDPEWYARMGTYALAALVASKTGGRGGEALMQFTKRFPELERFSKFADGMLGGFSGGGKTPIKLPVKGPDATVYDPNLDPKGHAFAQWWNDNVAPVTEASGIIGPKAKKAGSQIIESPDIEGAYKKIPLDPTAKTDFATILGIPATSTPGEVMDKFFAMAEGRELTPAMSARIVENWDRFGPVIGQLGHLKYWHGGDAPYRNVMESMKAITDPERAEHAQKAMRAANGFRADLWKGVHGYGNDLVESVVKGILGHGRSSDYYQGLMLRSLRKLTPTVAERERVARAIEEPNLHIHEPDWTPEQGLYGQLDPHEKFAVDFTRRISAEVRAAKLKAGVQLEGQPNYYARVQKRIANLEKALKGIEAPARGEANVAARRTPFGYMARQHRAFQLIGSPEEGIHAEAAYPTTDASNAQRAQWREQIKEDLKARAMLERSLKPIVDDPVKLEALAYAEIPDYSMDYLDSLGGLGNRGIFPDVRALYTSQVMEALKQTLVFHDADGQWHPLAIAKSESGQESSPTLNKHFKELHSADTTTGFYGGRGMGWKGIDGFGAGYIFHPALADPLNTALRFAQGDSSKALRAVRKISGVGKKFIMFNPAWHSTNMMGRFAWLGMSHPVAMTRALLKARGMGELGPEEAQQWWDAQEHEMIEHGGLPPQLNEDVVSDVGRYHMFATGDVETGTPLDTREPVKGFAAPAADALNAVKGGGAWWQEHVNGLMWSKIHDFQTLSYIALKDDAIHRGMSAGDARIYAASQATAWAGMVSPDRWMHSPALYGASQLALFAPNWWRTFPRLILNSYDRMGMKTNPALSHAWALNTAKTIGAMLLLKASSDNILNWLMSGHWQFQNEDGYKNQVTMDRFAAPDPNTGAHTVLEDPFTRQTSDLEKALGLTEAMKYGHWNWEYPSQGAAEVAAARVSPLVDALEMASNFDVYNTIKQRALKWVDPSHPYFGGSAEAAAAGTAAFTPFAFAMQTGLEGITAQDGTLMWGPWAGTKIPGWAMRAFNPNEPLTGLLSLIGVRGGYPSPIRSEERGLSSDEQTQLASYTNDWNTWLQKNQTSVQTGGQTWAEFAYQYRQKAAEHANKVSGLVGGTSEYMKGADGLLTRYEAVYNDPQAFDQNGDINWTYVQRTQDQLQAQSDPATWRQMVSLRDKRELQYPVLHVYKDSLTNYKNWQDHEATTLKLDGETLRSLIAQGAQSPNFQHFEQSHPQLAQYYRDKRKWETTTKQGFAYGLFTNNTYVMRIVAPTGDMAQAEQAEQKILPQIEAAEQAGQFVTPTGE